MKSSELVERTQRWLENNPDSPLHLVEVRQALDNFERHQKAWKALKAEKELLADSREKAWKALKKAWKKARKGWKMSKMDPVEV